MVGFLVLMGVSVPPIGGIFITDYFLLRRERHALDGARARLSLRAKCETVNPAGLIAWSAGIMTDYFLHWGIGAEFDCVAVIAICGNDLLSVPASSKHHPLPAVSAK
jgi:cytosine permease